MDYLLTSEYRHLDNAETKARHTSQYAPSAATPRLTTARLGSRSGDWKMSDEVIEELWRIKDDMAREHGYDAAAFGRHGCVVLSSTTGRH